LYLPGGRFSAQVTSWSFCSCGIVRRAESLGLGAPGRDRILLVLHFQCLLETPLVPAEYDVFVSHAWADGDRPRQIAEALKEARLRVWFDTGEISDFESITRAVQQGLAKSKTLLAYYSKAYPTRRACQWELTAAFLAAQQEGDPRQRVFVVNPEA